MDESHARSAVPRTTEALPDAARHPRWDGGCRVVCLLTTLHPERGLSRALIQHLTHEMPDIDFVLAPRPGIDAVWVVGYDPGSAPLVRQLRGRHPRSILVVTGRQRDRWAREVLAAGADFACAWPVPYAQLSALLHRRRIGRLL